MNVRKAIKISMAQTEINQKKLSELSGISETTISNTVSGKSSPSILTLSRLAKAMGLSYSELVGLGEES